MATSTDGLQKLTLEQVAADVGRSPKTVAEWVRRGWLKPIAGTDPAQFWLEDGRTALASARDAKRKQYEATSRRTKKRHKQNRKCPPGQTSLAGAAERKGVSENTIRNWFDRGWIKAVSAEKKPLRFRIKDVDRAPEIPDEHRKKIAERRAECAKRNRPKSHSSRSEELNRRDAAKYIKRCEATITRWRKEGMLVASNEDPPYSYTRAALDAAKRKAESARPQSLPPGTMRAASAAERAGVHVATIYTWHRDGLLEAYSTEPREADRPPRQEPLCFTPEAVDDAKQEAKNRERDARAKNAQKLVHAGVRAKAKQKRWPPSNPGEFPVREAAKYLNVHPTTVYNLHGKGVLKALSDPEGADSGDSEPLRFTRAALDDVATRYQPLRLDEYTVADVVARISGPAKLRDNSTWDKAEHVRHAIRTLKIGTFYRRVHQRLRNGVNRATPTLAIAAAGVREILEKVVASSGGRWTIAEPPAANGEATRQTVAETEPKSGGPAPAPAAPLDDEDLAILRAIDDYKGNPTKQKLASKLGHYEIPGSLSRRLRKLRAAGFIFNRGRGQSASGYQLTPEAHQTLQK